MASIAPAINLKPLFASSVAQSAIPVMVAPPNVLGGFITNPLHGRDQEVHPPEPLYVCQAGTPSEAAFAQTFAIQPGDTYQIIPGGSFSTFVVAATSGHRFSGLFWAGATNYPPDPIVGPFPPDGPVTQTSVLPSYPYMQYSDDNDVQAFFYAYNQLAQKFIDTINALNLPVYTDDNIHGRLLDWVARGVYGMRRPTLSSGQPIFVGPYNTWALNTIAFNGDVIVDAGPYQATTDDIFKRILTWHLYKGDGKIFNVRWLKRRVMRFILGVNGSAPNIDETYGVSVTIEANDVTITIVHSYYAYAGGTVFNGFAIGQTFAPLFVNDIASLAWGAAAGGTVTVHTSAPLGIPNNQTINVAIAGASPPGYNGTFTGTVTGASRFTYPLASSPGVATATGTYKLTTPAVATPAPFNGFQTELVKIASLDGAIFQEAVQSGALELPFQFTWSVST